MPKLELGDIKLVEKMMNKNLHVFKKYVDEGYLLVAPIPSCVLMYKQELPLLFPENSALSQVSKAFRDPFEFLNTLNSEGYLIQILILNLGMYHIKLHATNEFKI
jgi:Fe-S oxidoreductase